MKNTLFYGDNLDILRDKIKDETVDLCYIDPPFNSKPVAISASSTALDCRATNSREVQ